MIKSGLDVEKAPRTMLVGNSKHQEDLEMYGRLPDYDEFQGYDMGIDTDLSRIAEKMYADFHNPPWVTLKRPSVMVEIPRKLLRELTILAENDKKGIPNKKECFEGLPKSQWVTLIVNW